MHLIALNRGKEPIIPNNVDTPADINCSQAVPHFFSLPPTKNARESAKAKSGKRPSYHPAFSDVVSGVSHRARRDASRRQNQPVQAPGNALVLHEGTMPPVLLKGMVPQVPFVRPAFGTGLVFYMLPTALIRRPNDMLSSPSGQHILDYEPPRGGLRHV